MESCGTRSGANLQSLHLLESPIIHIKATKLRDSGAVVVEAVALAQKANTYPREAGRLGNPFATASL